MLCQPRSANWRQRPWISRGWSTRTRTISVSSDSAAECATVNLVRKQNSNAPESQPVRLRLRSKQGAAAPLSPCLPMTLAETRPRWRHHLCACAAERRAAAAEPLGRSGGHDIERLRNGRHLLASLHEGAERGLAAPNLFWVPTADRAHTILWTSAGSMTGSDAPKYAAVWGARLAHKTFFHSKYWSTPGAIFHRNANQNKTSVQGCIIVRNQSEVRSLVFAVHRVEHDWCSLSLSWTSSQQPCPTYPSLLL